MPVDEMIPEALRRAAGTVPDDLGDWDDIRERGEKRRRRHRYVSGGAGVLVGTLAVIGVLFAATGNDRGPSVATAPPASADVLATTNDGDLVVLSAADGHVIRTLATGEPGNEINRVTATPDGKTVFFQRAQQCEGTVPTIWRVPAAGGRVTNAGIVGGASAWPLVSPDGRWLAFVSSTVSSPGVCGPFDRLNVVRLGDPGPHGSGGASLDFPPSGIVVPIAWSADSSRLVVLLNEPPDSGQPYAEISVTDEGLTQLDRLPYPKGNGWDSLPSGEYVSAFPTNDTSRIATFDPATGEEQRRLTEIDEPLYLLDADSTGTRFLLEGPLADTSDGHDLYRASLGSSEAVKIAEHVTSAVWLPGAPETTTTTAPLADSAPTTIVARLNMQRNTRIVELTSSDGHARVLDDRVLGGLPEYVVSAASDVAYFDAFPGKQCEGEAKTLGGVFTVSRHGGSAELLATGFRPALSPDGTQLAYLGAECAPGTAHVNKHVVVLDIATGNEQTFTLPAPYADGNVAFEDIGPLRWLPDASSLVFSVKANSDVAYWRLDITPGELERLPVLGGSASVRDLQPLGTTGRWVGVVGGGIEGPPRVIEYDLDKGQIVRELFTVPWSADADVRLLDTDASGRHLLLLRTVGTGSETDPQHTELYRWSEGDAAPSFVARDVVAADW